MKSKQDRKARESQVVCDHWNAMFPIGTAVKFHHVIGEPDFTPHTTRSEAYVSEAGYPVIFLNKWSGYVALEAIEPMVNTPGYEGDIPAITTIAGGAE